MRFGGISRLYGEAALAHLQSAHVAVIGLGGVGSWAVEALVRSGIGELTLVDRDDICVTNVNRQLHAVDGEIGRPKAVALSERAAVINPDCVVHARTTFFNKQTADEVLATPYDYVVDAIDDGYDKCLLVASCRDRQLPLIVSGGSGGKRDPSQVQVADLGLATNDALLKRLRRRLRDECGYSKDLKEPFGVKAVYSTENPVFPWSDGTICAEREPSSSLKLDCSSGFGTASFVTGTFGFAAASEVVRHLAQINQP